MTYTPGDIVFPFTLPRVDGGELTVDPRINAATVVVFTANHCPYALAWHDRLDAVARDYADRGVPVIQISANDQARQPLDSREASAERVAKGHFSGPYLHDESQELARAFGAEKTPDVYVIDGTGRLAYHGAPDDDHESEDARAHYVRNALDQILAGQPVLVPLTEAVGCSIKWREDAPLTIGTAQA